MLIFGIHGIGWDLSMMLQAVISYKLSKKTTKTEKFEKSLKLYNINFMTIRHKLTDSCNIINSILKYKVMKTVSILWLNTRKQQIKKARKKSSEKPLKCNFHLKIF